MRFYGDMFRGFSGMLPQQHIGDAHERAAVFFSVARLGYLGLMAVALFGGVTIRMLGEGALTGTVVVLVIALYAVHVAFFRPPTGANETPAAVVDSGDESVVAALSGPFFVFFGWGSIFTAGMLVRSSIPA
jgi:hypothetical protein